MRQIFSVATAAFLLFSLIGVAPASAKTDQRLGVTHGSPYFELMQEVGMCWVRMDFNRNATEPQPGQYNWTEQDKMVDDAAKCGVKVLPILDYEAAWEKDTPQHGPATDEERASFARYAQAAASHFKGRVEAWEIWNEANTSFWKPDRNSHDYALLLKAVYPAIKRGDPDALVVGGSMADIEGMTDLDFLREICSYGAADHMDVLSIHPYRYKNNPEVRFTEPILKLRDILGQYGKHDMPMWITEIGFDSSGRGRSQAGHADYFVRSYLTSLGSGIAVYQWFNFIDDPRDFALVYRSGDQVVLKPAMRAIRACTDLIADAPVVGVMPWQDPLYGVIFQREKDVVVAAWRRHGSEPAPLPPATQVIDQYGRPGAEPVLNKDVHYFILPADSPVVSQALPHFVDAQMGGSPPPVKWRHHVPWSYFARNAGYSSPAVGDVNGDGQQEVVVASTERYALLCFSADGNELWQIKSENSISSAPVLADVDCDGKLEVLIGTNDKALWAVSGAGDILWKAPLGDTVDGSAATVADLDGDCVPEVIIGAGSIVYCFDAKGKERWRYTMTPLRGQTEAPKCPAPVAVGDVDGDGKPNVIVPAGDGSVRCLDGDGREIWRVMETAEPCVSGPVIGDLDGDGQVEILVALDARTLYCLRGVDGGELWRFPAGARVLTSIALGDVNGDGKAEIVFGDFGYSERIYCLSCDGRLLWQWTAFGRLESAPVLADVDGDGRIEVLVGDGEGWFSCLDDEGQLEWRYTTATDVEILESAAVADLDGDGKLEVVFGCHHGDLECLAPGGAPDPKLMPWPSRRQDPAGRAMLGK